MRIGFIAALFGFALCAFAAEETNTPPPNYAVQFYGTNPYNFPLFWPKQVQSLGTNTSVDSGWFVFTTDQFNVLKATNQSAFNIAKSNKTYQAQAKINANLARMIQLFNQIPASRAQAQTLSTNTGTMTTAQLTTAVRQTAGVIDGILEELQRLGPVLKQIYRPEEDE